MKKLSIKEKRIMGIFITATQDILKQEGVEKISIRNIAQRTGYNSATLYSYFKSLDILMIYASMGYLREYINELSTSLKDIDDPIEVFMKVYEVFNSHSFYQPELYFNMFYGGYSYHLPEIIANYYSIYPDELVGNYPAYIKSMLREGNIYERDKILTKGFLSNDLMSQQNLDILIDFTVRSHMSYLYDVKEGNVTDLKAHSKKFLNNLKTLIEALKS